MAQGLVGAGESGRQVGRQGGRQAISPSSWRICPPGCMPSLPAIWPACKLPIPRTTQPACLHRLPHLAGGWLLPPSCATQTAQSTRAHTGTPWETAGQPHLHRRAGAHRSGWGGGDAGGRVGKQAGKATWASCRARQAAGRLAVKPSVERQASRQARKAGRVGRQSSPPLERPCQVTLLPYTELAMCRFLHPLGTLPSTAP